MFRLICLAGLASMLSAPLAALEPCADDSVRKIPARQRPRSHPVAGSHAAAGRGRHLVPRRRRERGAEPHRLRAPVRTHDVHRQQAHAARAGRQAARSRRRVGLQRIDLVRSHQLLRHRCRPTSSSWRSGRTPTGWATCSTRSIRRRCPTSRTSFATSAGRRIENQPYGIVDEAVFHAPVSRRPSVPPRRSSARTPTSRRRGSPMCATFSSATTARTTRRWPSSAISISATAKRLVNKYFGSFQARARRRRGRRSSLRRLSASVARPSPTRSSSSGSTWRG